LTRSRKWTQIKQRRTNNKVKVGSWLSNNIHMCQAYVSVWESLLN